MHTKYMYTEYTYLYMYTYKYECICECACVRTYVHAFVRGLMRASKWVFYVHLHTNNILQHGIVSQNVNNITFKIYPRVVCFTENLLFPFTDSIQIRPQLSFGSTCGCLAKG